MQQLPSVGRIQGIVWKPAATVETSTVSVQYSSHNKEGFGDYEILMPFLDAMYLLNALRDLELRTGYEQRNQPPC